MANDWSTEELMASVEAYIEMRTLSKAGISFRKKDYYRKLSDQLGRTEKSVEYRMQNISHVYSMLGREWIQGLKPARNVGHNVARQIEELITKVEGQSFGESASFETQVQLLLKKGVKQKPTGRDTPQKRSGSVTQFDRDPSVVAWVLENANGICECCEEPAPFVRDNQIPFLEVHHVIHLADGGPDIIENAVAVCPNCHRELHLRTKQEPTRQVICWKDHRSDSKNSNSYLLPPIHPNRHLWWRHPLSSPEPALA